MGEAGPWNTLSDCYDIITNADAVGPYWLCCATPQASGKAATLQALMAVEDASGHKEEASSSH